MKRIIATSVLCLALAGCKTPSGPGVSTYLECERGTRLQIDRLGKSSITVRVNGDAPFRLPKVPAASGIAYSDARHTLRNKGAAFTWTMGRMVSEECRQVILPR